MTNGYGELARIVPVVSRALGEVKAAAWSEAARSQHLELIELVDVMGAEQHGLRPLAVSAGQPEGRRPGPAGGAPRPADTLTAPDRTLLDFALQFSIDVSSITDGQRSDVFRLLGDQAATFTAVVFVMDFVPRTRAALDALAGAGRADPGPSPEVDPRSGSTDTPIWDALGRFIREVLRLDALDPITSELIRLRGARQHRCRLCQSLRSRPALVAGADEDLFVQVDEYRDGPGLEPVQKAALAFTDAMIWTPGRLDVPARDLARLASPEQGVEIVLDVTKNALNKIAVALGADAAHVEDGIEIYDVDAAGELVYGVTLD